MPLFDIPFEEITFIFWQDAYVTTDDKPKLGKGSHLTVSFGVKVDEDKEFVYLSHYYCGINKGLVDPYTVIPKGMVKHTHVIEINAPIEIREMAQQIMAEDMGYDTI